MTDTVTEYEARVTRFLALFACTHLRNYDSVAENAFQAFTKWHREYYYDTIAHGLTHDELKPNFLRMHHGLGVNCAKDAELARRQDESYTFNNRTKDIMREFADEVFLREQPSVLFDRCLVEMYYKPLEVYMCEWRYVMFKDAFEFEWNHRINVIKKKRGIK